MGLSYRASRIIERVHAAIQTRGHRGLDKFRARIHEYCLDGKREAIEREFVAAASGDGGVLSGEEAGILFRELGGKDGSAPIAAVGTASAGWYCWCAVAVLLLRRLQCSSGRRVNST